MKKFVDWSALFLTLLLFLMREFIAWVMLFLILLLLFSPAHADQVVVQDSDGDKREWQDQEDHAATDRAYTHDAMANGDYEAAKTWDDRTRSEGGD
jgi:hypothetical protein